MSGSILKKVKIGNYGEWVHGLCATFHGYYANIRKITQFRLFKRFKTKQIDI